MECVMSAMIPNMIPPMKAKNINLTLNLFNV